MNIRALAEIMSRSRLFNISSILFGGKRDLYKALGYKRELDVNDYRSRYRRNAVANRIVKALPTATWRGGAEVIEDDDPTTETQFEAAFHDLDKRLKIWDVWERADKLAGIGRYAIILIGAPGNLDEPLENCTAEEIVYLQAFAEDDAKIQEWDASTKSPRFGRPVFYNVSRTTLMSPTAINSANTVGRRVHFTRVIHIVDGNLDDNIFGEPRLECVWNLLDDLEKVTGGGSEAFWKRADQGRHYDLDPTIKIDEPGKQSLKKQIHEYENELKRELFTRGVKVTTLGSDTADFSRPAAAIIDQVSAGTGIPQRILMGSERGNLASNGDRSNWDQRVVDRRSAYAVPMVIRPFIDRLIELGAMPAPVEGDYDVNWSELQVLDDAARAEIALKRAETNQAAGETVFTPNDIREEAGYPPLGESINNEPGGGAVPPADPNANNDPSVVPPTPAPVAAARKGGAAYAHVHRAADRFRQSRTTYRQRLIRRRAQRHESEQADQGTQGSK